MDSARSQWIFITMMWIVASVHGEYQIGVGIADCTGPPAEVIFMGYAKLSQKGNGLHLRQFSRAFIIDDGDNRLVFVSADIGMMGHGVRREVLKRLNAKYGELYNEDNVILSGTHTHGAPGGFLMDVVFDITCLGFVKQTFNAIVNGITKSIERAHDNMTGGRIFLNTGEVLNANINRSPTAYLRNPEEERRQYQYDVDKELVQLKFVSAKENKPLGVINWFPVHPTSMNNTNRLITSDNVGYASILFEERMNRGSLPGKGPFVAAFASSNLGDVSPNIKGARCINTGDPCEKDSSTCNGEAKYCIASGPGKDIFESTSIIANTILDKALELFSTRWNVREVTGRIKSVHQFVNMPEQVVEVTDTEGNVTKVKGCLPAMGYSFAAGTTDGPGEFDFKQATVTDNEFWNLVRNFLAAPTQEDIDCQAPKPILLATGRMKLPYDWQPSILSSQIALIGDVIIAAIPGEFTTMSGRRMKNLLANIAIRYGGSYDTRVILAGLCNTYTDYIATPEEYQLQRYEAASTIYGPHTLDIHLAQYKKLLESIYRGEKLDRGPEPEDVTDKQISFVPPVILDLPEHPLQFGDCVVQAPSEVHIGDTVNVEFISGHPRNNLMHGDHESYLTVERQTATGWETVATDASWETRFTWRRTFLASSRVTIQWEITGRYQPGVYRITHFGHRKSPLDGIKPYQGECPPFAVYPSNRV